MKKVVHACQIPPQKQQPTTTNKINVTSKDRIKETMWFDLIFIITFIFLSDSKVWITMIKYTEIPKLKKKNTLSTTNNNKKSKRHISSITLSRTGHCKMKFKYIHHRHPHCKVFQRPTELKMPVSL